MEVLSHGGHSPFQTGKPNPRPGPQPQEFGVGSHLVPPIGTPRNSRLILIGSGVLEEQARLQGLRDCIPGAKAAALGAKQTEQKALRSMHRNDHVEDGAASSLDDRGDNNNKSSSLPTAAVALLIRSAPASNLGTASMPTATCNPTTTSCPTTTSSLAAAAVALPVRLRNIGGRNPHLVWC